MSAWGSGEFRPLCSPLEDSFTENTNISQSPESREFLTYISELDFDPFTELDIWKCFYENKGPPNSNLRIKKKEMQIINKKKKLIYTILIDKYLITYSADEFDKTMEWILKAISYMDMISMVEWIIMNIPDEKIRKTQEKADEDKLKRHELFIYGTRIFIYEMLMNSRQIYLTLQDINGQGDKMILIPMIWEEKNKKREFLKPYNETYKINVKIKGETAEEMANNAIFPIFTLLYTNRGKNLITLQAELYEVKEYEDKTTKGKIIKIPQYINIKLYYMGEESEIKKGMKEVSIISVTEVNERMGERF